MSDAESEPEEGRDEEARRERRRALREALEEGELAKPEEDPAVEIEAVEPPEDEDDEWFD